MDDMKDEIHLEHEKMLARRRRDRVVAGQRRHGLQRLRDRVAAPNDHDARLRHHVQLMGQLEGLGRLGCERLRVSLLEPGQELPRHDAEAEQKDVVFPAQGRYLAFFVISQGVFV